MKKILIVVVAVVAASCTQSSDPTTTATPPPQATSTPAPTSTTGTSSTTSSTVATTTTSNPGEIDYPENPGTVDDLPGALTIHIGAPMPDPDLWISGPDDLDRWMAGWLDWLAWANANPAQGAEQLDVNMVPASQQYEDIQAALIDRAEAEQRLLGGGFLPTRLSGTFDEFFEDKTALRIVIVAGGPPSYLVNDAGDVVSVSEGIDGELSISALLRYEKERDEWLMETFEVLGRS